MSFDPEHMLNALMVLPECTIILSDEDFNRMELGLHIHRYKPTTVPMPHRKEVTFYGVHGKVTVKREEKLSSVFTPGIWAGVSEKTLKACSCGNPKQHVPNGMYCWK